MEYGKVSEKSLVIFQPGKIFNNISWSVNMAKLIFWHTFSYFIQD